MTAAARHEARVRQLPCVATLLIEGKRVPCEEIHHIQSVRNDLSDFLIVPISHKYHSRYSAVGIHALSRRGFERMFKISELDLLAKTQELLS